MKNLFLIIPIVAKFYDSIKFIKINNIICIYLNEEILLFKSVLLLIIIV